MYTYILYLQVIMWQKQNNIYYFKFHEVYYVVILIRDVGIM